MRARFARAVCVLLLPAAIGAGCVGSTPCAADAKLYADALSTTVDRRCAVCHAEGGLAASTGLRFVKGDDGHNLDALWAEARKKSGADGDQPLLLVKPTATSASGHAGGRVIEPGSDAFLALQTLVRRSNGELDCSEVRGNDCSGGVPITNRLTRRLSVLEYRNSLADLLGTTAEAGRGLPSDTVVNSFDNNEAVLQVTEAFADKARVLTEAAIRTVDLQRLHPCPGGTADEACAKSFVQTFGERVFRRPLSAVETGDFLALYRAIAKSEGFGEGVRWVLGAMLQSPHFLFRTELGTPGPGGGYTLTPWEIASELSYSFWQTTPDAALLAAARDGSLAQPEVILAQAQRLLADPRAQASLDHFVEQWLAVNQLPSAVKDAALYPTFGPRIAELMRTETLAFFAHVVRNGTFSELLTADYSFLNAELAAYYGLPGPAADPTKFQKTSLAGARVGILTQGAFLASQSRPTHTSPTGRGKLVREMILGEPVEPPPPNVDTTLADVEGLPTMRAKLGAHAASGVCLACHQRLDALGFGFEGFESDGRAVKAFVDTSGAVKGSLDADGAFGGPVDLTSRLANSAEAQRAFALHWFRYLSGVKEDGAAVCAARSLQTDFVKGDRTIAGLLLAIVAQPRFSQRVAPGPIGPETAVDPGGPFDPGPAPPPPLGTPDANGMTTTLAYQNGSPWGSGYCKDATTTNNGTASGDWTATVPMGGYKLSSHWSSNVTVSGTTWVFSGVDYNKTLAPKASATWGFCAGK